MDQLSNCHYHFPDCIAYRMQGRMAQIGEIWRL